MSFERVGYAVVNEVIDETQCQDLIMALPPIETSGSRLLLRLARFRYLAEVLRAHEALDRYLRELVAVECIHFRKSFDHNWAVALHRDSVLPVKGNGVWRSVGVKEGMECVRPPREFMDHCVAVRLHLDGAPVEDISVVPGSHLDEHKHDRSNALRVSVSKGGALVLRPTLAHASSRLQSSGQRRVFHYVFAPRELPSGYSWYTAV